MVKGPAAQEKCSCHGTERSQRRSYIQVTSPVTSLNQIPPLAACQLQFPHDPITSKSFTSECMNFWRDILSIFKVQHSSKHFSSLETHLVQLSCHSFMSIFSCTVMAACVLNQLRHFPFHDHFNFGEKPEVTHCCMWLFLLIYLFIGCHSAAAFTS